MILPEGWSRRGPQTSATPESTLSNPEQRIADLERQHAKYKAERDEALAQQTATAEVLQVINTSEGDLAPVFDAMLEKAHGICRATMGALFVYENGLVRALSVRGFNEAHAGLIREPFDPTAGHRALMAGERLVHRPDVKAMTLVPGSADDVPAAHSTIDDTDARTSLMIPLLKDDVVLGCISAYRPEVRLFAESEIALLRNFAAQAVIAIENARLLTETREALEQQTATADVLRVINSSPGNLAPVLDAMLEKAVRLCEAVSGALFTYDGERFHTMATSGVSAAAVGG